jgi:hypothetical protein
MKMTSITIHRIANGKLVEKWSEKDMVALLTQIGVLPRMGQHWVKRSQTREANYRARSQRECHYRGWAVRRIPQSPARHRHTASE